MIRLRAARITPPNTLKTTFSPTTIIPQCNTTKVQIRLATNNVPAKKKSPDRNKIFNQPVFPTSVTPTEIKRLKIRALETAIATHSEKARWALILQLFNYMLREGHMPQKLTTYHTLLIACKNLKRIDSVPRIVECIENNNLSMTAVTFQLLLEAFETTTVSSEAIEHIWAQIKALKLQPNPPMYISTVNIYLLANEYDKAVSYFEELFKQNPFSTASLFMSFLKYFSSKGNVEMMKKYFDRYKSQGFPADPTPYNFFLEHHSKLPDIPSLTKVWNDMKDEFITPNPQSYLHMINAFSGKGDMVEAERYLTLMSTKMKPDIAAYNAIAKGYARLGNREQVEATLKKAKDNKEEYNKDTFAFLIDFYSTVGDKKAMLQTSHDMIASGFTPSTRSYSTIIRTTAFHKDYAMMETYFEDMRRRGLAPNEYIYRVIMKAWAIKGDYINFLRYIRKMNVEDQITPSPKTMEWISMFIKQESASEIPQQTIHKFDVAEEGNVPEAELVQQQATQGRTQEATPEETEEVMKIVAQIDEQSKQNYRPQAKTHRG